LTGLVYIPAQQIAFVYTAEENFVYRPGEWNLGVNLTQDPLPADPEARRAIEQGLQGRLLAWDPVRQTEAWRVEHDGPWNGGTLATAGNLVFQGLADRTFRAYRADDGSLLWSFPTQNAILTGPVSYAVDGQQFIAVTAGNGGGLPLTLPSFGGPQPEPNGRVLAFKLDGGAVLPPFEPALRAPVATEVNVTEEGLAEGFALFGRHCAACHGIELLSAGVLPDLRTSAAVADARTWRAIVLDGALEARGMVGFASRLDQRQAEILRGYVASEARRLEAAPP